MSYYAKMTLSQQRKFRRMCEDKFGKNIDCSFGISEPLHQGFQFVKKGDAPNAVKMKRQYQIRPKDTLASIAQMIQSNKDAKKEYNFSDVCQWLWNSNHAIFKELSTKPNQPWEFLAYFNFGVIEPTKINWACCMEYGFDPKSNLSDDHNYKFKGDGSEHVYYPVNPISKSGKNTIYSWKKHNKWFCDYLPISEKNNITYYIDGEKYCNDLYNAIKDARKEICLTGLHFSGQFGLVRNASPKMLQEVLADKSKEGVKIYLLVNQFWENEGQIIENFYKARRDLDKYVWKIGHPIRGAIMGDGGLARYLKFTHSFFTYLNEHGNGYNIHAFCDIHQGYIFHSNHQKTIIIDKKVAFLGGIDLTDIDGDRWDTQAHVLSDNRRNYDKPERYWHDVHMRIIKSDESIINAVDFVYANFLGRYNYGYLFKPIIENGILVSKQINSYDKLRPNGKDARDYVDHKKCIYPTHKNKNISFPLVQIVRSMPEGNWDNYEDHQHPLWNKSKETECEHSCRDAYLIGIRAAEKFIYLENQWIADEKIWTALKDKANQRSNDKNFRIIIVLPKKYLKAAGFGRDQDINLEDYVKELAEIFKAYPDNFGVFSIIQPEAHQNPNKKHFQIPECSWDYMYVHSKIMIVDDKWALIGSANAGGISLTGIGFKSEPDTELSAIIVDEGNESIVKKFRVDLWREHLGLTENDVADYKKGAGIFHSLAYNQIYDTSSAKRVHYNILYYPFSKMAHKKSKGVWKHLKWDIIKHQLDERIKDDKSIYAMHQTYYNLSGPLTALNMLADCYKDRYKKLVRNVFESGKDDACNINIKNEDLPNAMIDPAFPILEIDWMLASAMIDSSNHVFDFQGESSEWFAIDCWDSDMIDFMEKIVQCKGGVKHYSCENYGELSEAQKATHALETSQNKSVLVAVKISTSLLVEKNEDLIEKHKKEKKFDLGDPKYWISRIDNNPFLWLKRDRAYPLYPGFLTPYDIKYVLSDKMFIRLLKPLEFIMDGSKVSEVKMTFWTWGKVSTLTVPLKKFEKSVYGFFVGYRSESAEKRATEEHITTSGDPLELSKNMQRDHIHQNLDKANVNVSCVSGSILVEISVRVWWEWKLKSRFTLQQSQSKAMFIDEESRVYDQDIRVRITAKTNCRYSINMKSYD